MYLKSALRYKFLILDAYPPNLYLSEQGCEDLWLFVEAIRGLKAKEFGTH